MVYATSVALVSCAEDPGTDVRLVITLDGTPEPSELRLSWMRNGAFVFMDRPVAKARQGGTVGAVLSSVLIEIDDPNLPRAAVVRGLNEGVVVCEGTARLEPPLTAGSAVPIRLRQGRLPDFDANGIPDDLDGCLHGANPQGGCLAPPTDGPPPATDAPVEIGDATAPPPPGTDGSATRPTDGRRSAAP